SVGDLGGVGARRLKHGYGDGRLPVEQGAQRIVGRAHFDAGDVPEACDLAFRSGLDDDVAEFFGSVQAALRIDVELEVHIVRRRRGADDAGGGLHVLLADGIADIAGGKTVLCRLLWVDPHAHRIVSGAEDLHLADTLDAGEAALYDKR